jgi:hypothetical protein
VKKLIWKSRLPILVGAFSGNLVGMDLSAIIIFYIIAFAVFVGLLDVIRQKIYPTINESLGCGIIFFIIVSMIIIRQLYW